MVAIQAYREQAQYCKDDKAMLQWRVLEVQRSGGGLEQRADLYLPVHYCPTCKSYPTNQGMNKDPLEAARNFYRENPAQGRPEEVTAARPL